MGYPVKDCLDFAKEAARRFDIPFFIMSYYNILFKYGVDRFAAALADRDLTGPLFPTYHPKKAMSIYRRWKTKGFRPSSSFLPLLRTAACALLPLWDKVLSIV